MRILVLNGPNLNFLGIREVNIYGKSTYQDLVNMVKEHALELGVDVDIKQSNHEGALVDFIQEAYLNKVDAIIINPAAYTHTSVAILDALKAVKIPFVEVHISDVTKREDFRQISYIRPYASLSIMGHGLDGYLEAMDYLVNEVNK